MSTATKLTYLNDTKSKIKDSINSLGGEITSQTTFRQYATELDSIYSRLPKVSGTGSNISLSPTLKGRLSSTLKGDTQQDGTPTPDNPKEIKSVTGLQKVKVEGKNLLNPNANSITKNGITFTNNNGIFSISGTATANTGLSLTTDTIILENNTAYTQSVITESGTQNVNVVPAFKNSQGTIQYNYLTNNQTKTTTDKMTLYSYDVYIPNGTTVNWSFKVQLEHSSTVSEYQEYQTPQEYEINLGKNLLKFPYAESSLTRDGITYTVNNDGSIKISGTATATSYINLYSNLSTNLLEKGKTYTYSISPANSNIRLTVLERYNNTWNENVFGSNKITFTISNNSEGQLIRLIVTNGSTINTTISPQVEEGSEATSYSPYFTPIHLYEGDQIIGTPYNWSIVSDNGEVVFDGSDDENWQKDGVRYRIYIPGSNPNKTRGNCFSNYFHYISSYNTDGGCFVYEERAYFILEQTTATVGEFKTWLSTHNTKVVYPLTEPTTEPITNTELIEDLNNFYNKAKSYNGQTNISVQGDLQMILDVSAIIGD